MQERRSISALQVTAVWKSPRTGGGTCHPPRADILQDGQEGPDVNGSSEKAECG